jgi:predicted nucleic acid-binding protein
VSGVTYDSGALIAAERNAHAMWALHRRVLQRGLRPTVPTVVLGQVWRGGPQVQLSRVLHGCRIEPLTERDARSAGAALAATEGRDLIDAVVVVSALARGDLVVTSDPADLARIAEAVGGKLILHFV